MIYFLEHYLLFRTFKGFFFICHNYFASSLIERRYSIMSRYPMGKPAYSFNVLMKYAPPGYDYIILPFKTCLFLMVQFFFISQLSQHIFILYYLGMDISGAHVYHFVY